MAPAHSALKWAALPSRVFAFRLINVFLASLLIPVVFKAARIFFLDEHLAISSCLLLIAMPELYIDSARVGNQTLAMLLYGALTLLCLSALSGKPRYLLIGTTLGLLLLTKAYTLAAIPPTCFAVVASARRLQKRWSWVWLSSLCFGCSAIVASWWYVRNLQLTGRIIWVDGAPIQHLGISQLFRDIANVNWLSASRALAGSYIWFGNWSFLSVRSWMYEVIESLMLVAIIGAAIQFVRSVRSKPDSIELRYFILILLLYGSFLAALGYHVLANSNATVMIPK